MSKAINRDCAYSQACSLSHDSHVISHSFVTFNNLFKLSLKLGFPTFFEIHKLNHHKIQVPTCLVAEEF